VRTTYCVTCLVAENAIPIRSSQGPRLLSACCPTMEVHSNCQRPSLGLECATASTQQPIKHLKSHQAPPFSILSHICQSIAADMAGNKKAKSPRRQARKPSPSRVPSPVRFGIATVVAAAAVGWGLGRWYADNPIGFSQYSASFVDWDARRDEVKEAFVTSWQGYSQYAWGESDCSHSAHGCKTLF